MHILVTGAKGQVGSELFHLHSRYPQWQFTFTDRTELDICQAEAVHAYFAQHAFDVCINAAAYTAVDKAEDEIELCYAVNDHAVANLADACKAYQVKLIHISSDYVYHNEQQNTPYLETDPLSPKGVYAKSKMLGEEKALSHNPGQSMVIRTSWVYSTFGNNFVKTMLKLAQSRPRLTVIFDQVGTPTYARDLAELLLMVVYYHQEYPDDAFGGVFNYSNEGVTSWYDFAQAIFEMQGIDSCQVVPIETREYPTPAKRPHFSLMNKAKIKESYSIDIPHWRDGLKRYFADSKES